MDVFGYEITKIEEEHFPSHSPSSSPGGDYVVKRYSLENPEDERGIAEISVDESGEVLDTHLTSSYLRELPLNHPIHENAAVQSVKNAQDEVYEELSDYEEVKVGNPSEVGLVRAVEEVLENDRATA